MKTDATHDMKMAKSKSDRLIVLAKQAGYYADLDGKIFTPEGKQLIGGLSRSGHRNFVPKIASLGVRSSVLQHRFVAYYFLGGAVFEHDLVRHLNDVPDDNRLCNLAPGSHKENRADIPREKLRSIAKGNARSLVERSRKLSDDDVKHMRSIRETSGLPYKKLAERFGVSTMTAYRAVTGQSWGTI